MSNSLPRIFVAPRSGEQSTKNFEKTIEGDYKKSELQHLFTIEDKNELKNVETLMIWGNKPSLKSRWEKMRKDDWVLFYQHGIITYAGRLLYKTHNKKIADELWGSQRTNDGKLISWEYVFFIKDLRRVQIPYKIMAKFAEYRGSIVQGFLPFKEKGVENIIKKFGSIEKFLESFPVKFEEKLIIGNKVVKEINSIKKDATQFEKQIKDLLNKLEFNDVEGARDDFLIKGIQVDVCGGWDNALLVIECKSKQEIQTSNLRSAIHEFRGKIEILKKGFSEHPIYKKYTYFQFIIVTKNIVVRKVDIDLANENPRIYIWNDEFLEYYSNLYGFIKPYAKYDLLGEMKIRPLCQKPIKVLAFRTIQEKKIFYNFLIDPRELLEVSFVARRNVTGERYYQRIIDEKRLKKISEYIKNGGIFPNNIVVAFRPDLKINFDIKRKFEGNLELGILEFPKDYRSCWIIDGQHRLYSFAGLKDFYCNVSVTAFENLEIQDQRKFFLDINRNQKPVDSDLLWDLSGDVVFEKEGIISNIVKQLNTDYHSPLWRGIYYPSAGIRDKNEKIKISAICVSIKKNRIVEELLSQNTKNPLYAKNPEEQIKKTHVSLEGFLITCKKIFPHNWELKKEGFVLTNGGIAVLLGLFEKIIVRISQQNNTIPSGDTFEKYLKPLRKKFENADPTQLKKMRLSTTSEGGKSDLLNELVLQIREETGDNMFGGEIKSMQLEGEFRELEKNLKKLIYKRFYNPENENWFKEIVDKYTYELAFKHAQKQGKLNIDELYLQLTLGECFSIIRNKKAISSPIFIDEEKESAFSNEKMFEAAITTISEMRNRLVIHYTGTKKKQYDEIIVKIYLDKMNSCINDELKNINI